MKGGKMKNLVLLSMIALIGLSGCCCPCAKKMQGNQPAEESQPEASQEE